MSNTSNTPPDQSHPDPIIQRLLDWLKNQIADLFTRVGSLETPAQARVYNDANISITTSGTPQALTFNSERYDTANFHDTSSNTSRLTVPTAGLYHIGGAIVWAASATGFRQLTIRLNGTTAIAQELEDIDSSVTHSMTVSTDYPLAANEYVELVVAQTAASPHNVIAAGNTSPEFWIHRIGSQT